MKGTKRKKQSKRNLKPEEMLVARGYVYFNEEEYAALKDISKEEELPISVMIRQALYATYRPQFKRRIIGFDK